jgi:hypothetical protein
VRLSPLGTSTTNWPVAPAPDDRCWWMFSCRWNENWQGKPKYSEKTCPSANLSTTNPTRPELGSNTSRNGRNRRLTAWDVVRPKTHLSSRLLSKVHYLYLALPDVHLICITSTLYRRMLPKSYALINVNHTTAQSPSLGYIFASLHLNATNGSLQRTQELTWATWIQPTESRNSKMNFNNSIQRVHCAGLLDIPKILSAYTGISWQTEGHSFGDTWAVSQSVLCHRVL